MEFQAIARPIITLIVCRLIVVIKQMMTACQRTLELRLESMCASCVLIVACRKKNWLN
jgi:hypothetical protein